MAAQPKCKDPIRDAPLRDPGQLLRERAEMRFQDEIVPWLAVAVFALVMAGIEWLRWFFRAPYAPVLYTIFAAVVAMLATWRIRHTIIELRQWKLGLKGERAVGHFLQATLAPRDY